MTHEPKSNQIQVYVTLADGESVRQRTFHDQFVFDLDTEGRIIGVEVLGARSVAVNGTPVQSFTEWGVRLSRPTGYEFIPTTSPEEAQDLAGTIGQYRSDQVVVSRTVTRTEWREAGDE